MRWAAWCLMWRHIGLAASGQFFIGNLHRPNGAFVRHPWSASYS